MGHVNMVIDLLGMYQSRFYSEVLCGFRRVFLHSLVANQCENNPLFVLSPLFKLSSYPHKSSNKLDLDINIIFNIIKNCLHICLYHINTMLDEVQLFCSLLEYFYQYFIHSPQDNYDDFGKKCMPTDTTKKLCPIFSPAPKMH